MEARDDKLIAVIGLLLASLICIIFLFALTWLTDVRQPPEAVADVQSCAKKPETPPLTHP